MRFSSFPPLKIFLQIGVGEARAAAGHGEEPASALPATR